VRRGPAVGAVRPRGMDCCTPVPRCCGCVSLRRGSWIIAVASLVYGVSLLLLHALIQEEGVGGAQRFGWWLQELDLDWSFRHIAQQDHQGQMAGLGYGLVVTIGSVGLLGGVIAERPVWIRVGMVLLYLEAAGLVILTARKSKQVCALQPQVYPSLPQCPLLLVGYIERTIGAVLIALYAATVLGSYAADLEADLEDFVDPEDEYGYAERLTRKLPPKSQGLAPSKASSAGRASHTVRPPLEVGPPPSVYSSAPSAY